jgi:2-keto-4-pentenoate hydratase/2-oxohepta-3-ene-1,7-dioic acid hydratase in catechol pathway
MDGKILQNSNTVEMSIRIPQIIAYVSQGITLTPGDIIATGTPAGIATHHDPPAYLRDGVSIELEIDNLGRLINYVKRA